MATFVIVGKISDSLRKKLRGRGDNYFLLQKLGSQPDKDSLCLGSIEVAFNDRAALTKSVDLIRGRAQAVIATFERYILPTAWVAEDLMLPGLSVKSAEASTDKLLMRQMFSKAAQKISPEFALVTTEVDVLNFAARHPYPLMLKPANLMKSLLVTKNNNEKELLKNFHHASEALDEIYQKYDSSRDPKLIIEAFMPGSLHSVAAIIDKEGKVQAIDEIADLKNGHDVGYSDNFLYSRVLPSALVADAKNQIFAVSHLGVKALDMRSCPAHIEIILTPDGPKIIEIGARLGGYRDNMYKLANGIDLMEAFLDNALDRPIQVSKQKDEACAVVELFPKKPGIFRGIRAEQQLRQLSSLKNLSIRSEIGNYVGKSADGYKRCAVITLQNSDKTQLHKDLKFINESVSVETN